VKTLRDSETTKTNLKGLDLTELQTLVASLGEDSYRAQQIFKWLYGSGVSDFEQMTNLSKTLRQKLTERARIGQLQLVASKTSAKDQSVKFLFQLEDGLKIESVLMVDDGRTTLCISTQVGCAIDCTFCATGMMGLQRHLTAGEIVDQLLQVQNRTGQTVSNVVCMGMGEPFHNYENVIKACELLSHDLGPNLAKRHIVVSTSGLVPKIIRYADEGHKFRLAISLNATTDEMRSQLMPLNKKWPLRELLNAARYYTKKSEQMVTFEYVLMDGINDSVADAARLKALVRGIFCKINLIPYNATEGKFRRPSEAKISRFYERMASLRAPVTIRWSKGDDIDAACGQLAVKKN
jgi:23S rRNA (adenine2503-C2)-methyltransferase